MQFFVGPVEVAVHFEKLNCGHFSEHGFAALLVAASICDEFRKQPPVLNFEPKISRKLQFTKAVRIQAPDRHVHHPELPLLSPELLTPVFACLEFAV